MKKYYFELILENKNTNGAKCLDYSGIGATLNNARRNLINDLESRAYDFTYYVNELQEEFIKVNYLNDEQVNAIKLLTMYDNGMLEEDLEDFNFYSLIDFGKIEKLLNRKLKNVDCKKALDIAIDCLAPGYYHDLKVIRHYR